MVERGLLVEGMRPFARRHFRHAAEKAVRRPGTDEHAPIVAQKDESRAAPQASLALGFLDREGLCIPTRGRRAVRAQRTARTGGIFRGAQGRPEIHQGLREIAGPAVRREPLGGCANDGLPARQRLADREQARDHALDIAVHRYGACVIGDRRDRRRGVVADARQVAQLSGCLREFSPVPVHDGAGAGVQIARPRVIAEARPQPQHVLEISRGQRMDGRETGEEAQIIRDGRGDRGLLQHDLGKPDPVRIARLAGDGAPGKDAPVSVVPGEQPPAEFLHSLLRPHAAGPNRLCRAVRR